MSNDTEARDKVILDAISKLREDFEQRFDNIEAKSDRAEEKINKLSQDFLQEVSEVKQEVAKVDGKLSVIEGRLNDISGRVNFQGNWFLLVLTLLVGGMLTLFSKIVFFS